MYRKMTDDTVLELDHYANFADLLDLLNLYNDNTRIILTAKTLLQILELIQEEFKS